MEAILYLRSLKNSTTLCKETLSKNKSVSHPSPIIFNSLDAQCKKTHHKSWKMNWARAMTIALGGYNFYHLGISKPMGIPLAEYVYKLKGRKRLDFLYYFDFYLLFGGALGASIAVPFCNKLGRIKTLMWLELISFIACVMLIFENVYVLFLARGILGGACSSNVTIALIAINEMFSSDMRGKASLLMYAGVTTAILFAYFMPLFYN